MPGSPQHASAAPPTTRHALVTGGVSGIGAAITLRLAAAGYHVLATGLTGAERLAFADEARDLPFVVVQPLDVTSASSIAACVDGIERLDLLVNAAGIILRDGAEHTPDGFERVLDVNLHGTFRMCHACRPLLAQSRGCVVNLASMLTYFGSAAAPAYSASKGGIGQLTRSLAIAWAADGIRVNAVAPGWIETPLTDALRRDPARSKAIIDRTPLQRWGRPAEVAGAVRFLSSPEAGFITGAILPVDGGYSAA